jgi:hypothetical protein
MRPQVDQYLVYNVTTDELHLLGACGWRVLQLCDGSRTVADLVQEIATALGVATPEVAERVGGFLAALLERGLIEEAGA